jgi:hypothetical protein
MEYKKENYKGCVVVQGKTYPEALPKIKEKWEGYCIIFSTWMGEEEYYSADDIVLFSEKPESNGTSNLNLQKITTWNGVTLAHKMGWEKVLKWRSDMWPTDADSLWKSFSEDGLNFLCWVNFHGGYVTDYFVYGNYNDIISIYDIENYNEGFPEQHITRRMKELGLDRNVKFMGNQLHSNVDIFWDKNGIWLSSYKEMDIYQYIIPK